MTKHFRVSGSVFSKLEDLGVPAAAVLRRAGLSPAYVDQPRVLLSTEELFALWRAIGEVSANPAIGLLLSAAVNYLAIRARHIRVMSGVPIKTQGDWERLLSSADLVIDAALSTEPSPRVRRDPT